ncbi:DUF221-domain-containing protein [Agrocybe pediades]|nr:DUF221-domain-containing protein [Agrocybe pediades]
MHPLALINADGIQRLFDISASLEPRAVAIQVALMTVLSILTLVTFNILRPRHTTIYEPKTIYHEKDKPPPRASNSFLGWIPPLLHNHEPELLSKIGLDAVAFLRFLHLVRWLLTLTSLISCGVLIPIDFLYTLSTNQTQNDFFSAASIQHVQGNRLYAHIATSYAFTLLLVALTRHHWRDMSRLRNKWFRSAEYQRSFHARTLYISNIPHRRQSDIGLYKIFTNMQLPYKVTSVHIGRHVGKLPKLVERHDEAVRRLEAAVEKYNTHGGKRPTVVVGGFWKIGGKRKDAITYYASQVKHAEAAVAQYRAQMNIEHTENYGFATMESIPVAHAAALELRGQHPKGLTFKLAPNPKDIIWSNIRLSKSNKRVRRAIGFTLLFLFCLMSLVPLFPVASLANLDALAQTGWIPFLQTWINVSPITYSLVSGFLPPAISAAVGYFIPRLMRWLSKRMGAITHSSLDRLVIARYFAFLIISQLIIFTVLGVIFHSVLEIIEAIQREGVSVHTIVDNLDKLPARITRTYVDQSSFWLKWFPLQGFLIIFDLARLSELIWLSFRARVYGRTPRDIQEGSKPKVFDYGIQYSKLLFMTAVGILFAPLAPLVTLAAAIVFWLCSWIYKYQLVFMFITRVESGGRAWNVVVNRILFSAMFMQVVLILTIALQVQFRSLQFLASIPPLIALLLFKHYLNRKFANDFEYYVPTRQRDLSRSVVHTEESDTAGGNKLEQRYCHPALQAELLKPMVHSRALPLLRRGYRSPNEDSRRALRDRDRSRGLGHESKSRSKMEKKARMEEQEEDDEALNGVVFTPVHEVSQAVSYLVERD